MALLLIPAYSITAVKTSVFSGKKINKLLQKQGKQGMFNVFFLVFTS